MKRLHLLLALLTILAVPIVAWGVGRLEPMMGTPYAQFLTSAVVTSDTQVLGVPGFLQCIMIWANDSQPIEGDIVVYDSATEANTVVFAFHPTTSYFTPFQICPQRMMTAGIYLGFTTTTDVKVTVSYR